MPLSGSFAITLNLFHYLDDFFFAGSAESSSCLNALLDMLLLCRALNAPVKPEKVIDPSTLLTILGIELDSAAMQARLPQDKLSALLDELLLFQQLYVSHQSCTKRQLLSLIGKLAFACKVIPAGRIFLRRLLDTAHSVPNLDDHITISQETIKDVRWWLLFAEDWNGVAFFLQPNWTPADQFQLYTDASGSLGFGAYWDGNWLCQQWSPDKSHQSIEWKELYAIVIACETWGSQ